MIMLREMPGRLLLMVSLLLVGWGALVPARHSAAQETKTCEPGGAQDLPPADNGQPLRLIRLICDFDNSGNLTGSISVLDRRPTPASSDKWFLEVTGEDEMWFFDYGIEGHSELTIDFRQRGNELVADLYENRLDLRTAQFSAPDSLIEGLKPTVSIVALNGKWSTNGTPSLNLDILVDGPVIGFLGSAEELVQMGVKHDGEADYSICVRDLDGDGLPDYDWRTAFFTSPQATFSKMSTTTLVVNTEDNELPLRSPLPWPYLGPVTYGYDTSSPAQTGLPPIQVQWSTGQIQYLGEFVSSRGNENQWFMYSDYPLVPGDAINVPSFEAPFAWYDLANDDDRIPELAARVVYYKANDPHFKAGASPLPVINIRYSWDQDNDDRWDFKLGLAAHHEVEDTVTLRKSGVQIRLLSYDGLPTWIAANSWDIVTFVSAETVELTGEGLYEWDITPTMMTTYFSGETDEPLPLNDQNQPDLSRLRYYEIPQGDTMSIETGMRGEYQFSLGTPVRLYISGVDHKLHLFRAAGSTWNIDGQHEIRASDNNGDGYLDEWQYLDRQQVVASLYHTDSYLIYADQGRVLVGQGRHPLVLDEMLPPATHEQWVSLGQALDQVQYQVDDAASLQYFFDKCKCSVWTLQHATLRDFRFLENGGFRFAVDLAPDFGLDSGFSAGNMVLGSGSYVIGFDGARLRIVSETPGVLGVREISLGHSPVRALEPVPISVAITNGGLQDAHAVTVALSATQGSTVVPIGERQAEAPAGETVMVRFMWSPPQSGPWTVSASAEVDGPASNPVEMNTVLDVQPAPSDWPALLSLNDTQPDKGIWVVTFLFSTAIIAICSFLLIQRAAQETP